MSKDWFITRSGVRVVPLHLVMGDIRIDDIAWSLAHQNRAIGHWGTYSVAQHAVHAADLVLERTGDTMKALMALHHDDSEAYLGDIIRPLKERSGFKKYVEAEAYTQDLIYSYFGLLDVANIPAARAAIRDADDAMLVAEIEDLAADCAEHNEHLAEFKVERFPLQIVPWTADGANKEYLRCHDDLAKAARRFGVVPHVPIVSYRRGTLTRG